MPKVALANEVMALVLARIGVACAALVPLFRAVNDTPKLMASVVPVPGNHKNILLPNKAG